LAYKAEHAVDLETGAVVAVTVATGDAGDTATILETLPEAGEHIAEVEEGTTRPMLMPSDTMPVEIFIALAAK
jgi:transposase